MVSYFRPVPLSQLHDPSEPHLAHERMNCTCAVCATAVRAATSGAKQPRGGDIRHKQPDQVGGTDLNDITIAAAKYGVKLTKGHGKAEMIQRRREGRFLILQGDSGELDGSCSEGQDTAHAVGVHPDDNPPASHSGDWLIGDPWCHIKGTNRGKWRWLDRDDVFAYARRSDFWFVYTKPLKRIA